VIEIHDSVELSCTPEVLAPWVDDLGAYPQWMGLVHKADPIAGEEAAWSVDLRARLGPLARSKRLRMVRTEYSPGAHARFEREEHDGKTHGKWVLAATYEPRGGGTHLVMDLVYDGSLWTAGLLEKTLQDEIERGKARLAELVSEPTR